MKCLSVKPKPFEELLLLLCETWFRSITICLGDFTANRGWGVDSPHNRIAGADPAALSDAGPSELSRLEEHELPAILLARIDDCVCDGRRDVADQAVETEHSRCNRAASWNGVKAIYKKHQEWHEFFVFQTITENYLGNIFFITTKVNYKGPEKTLSLVWGHFKFTMA